jgi:hypothetical protein
MAADATALELAAARMDISPIQSIACPPGCAECHPLLGGAKRDVNVVKPPIFMSVRSASATYWPKQGGFSQPACHLVVRAFAMKVAMTDRRAIVDSGRHIRQHSDRDAGTDRDMACLIRRSVGLVLGTVLAAACGGATDSKPGVGESIVPTFSGLEPAPQSPPAPPAEPPSMEPVVEVTPTPEVVPPPEPPAAEVVEEPAVDPNVCRAPDGVSGAPQNLPEVVALLNSLPRPTTLPCFLQALERPLQVYLTESDQSLQPSPGPRSPRTFIVNQPLVMSIVFEGSARATLEIGYRTADTRSIKTELTFPLRKEVTFANLFDEVKDPQVTNGQATRCSACHTSETQIFNDEIQAEAFESDIYPPFEVYEVDVESLRSESASCDAAEEPERCAMLSAVFDYGDVVTAPNGILFSL